VGGFENQAGNARRRSNKLKNILRSSLLVLLVCFVAALAPLSAQVVMSGTTGPSYSSSNTYFPTFFYPTATVTGSGTGTFKISGVATVVLRISGTFTSGAITVSVSNDGTNYSVVNVNPVAATTTATASIAANGMYAFSTAGMTSVKYTSTAVGSLVLTSTGTALVHTTR
jgi:cytochrome c biogenesis factor